MRTPLRCRLVSKISSRSSLDEAGRYCVMMPNGQPLLYVPGIKLVSLGIFGTLLANFPLRFCVFWQQLTGTIPKELGSLHLITELRIQENKLEGEIPQLLGDMCSLRTLDLSSNRLQGLIPARFGNLTNLRKLWLRYCYYFKIICSSLSCSERITPTP